MIGYSVACCLELLLASVETSSFTPYYFVLIMSALCTLMGAILFMLQVAVIKYFIHIKSKLINFYFLLDRFLDFKNFIVTFAGLVGKLSTSLPSW